MLENFDLKSYLTERGFNQEIIYIFQSKLLSTYNSIIKNEKVEVERSFISLLDLHKDLIEKGDLSGAGKLLLNLKDQKNIEIGQKKIAEELIAKLSS